MDIILRAPATAALVGASTDRLLVEVTDPRFGGALHLTAGQPDVDPTWSIEIERNSAVVTYWPNDDSGEDELAYDRADVVAALAADGIEVAP